ncbi:MAG: Holliday junction branch migration protein RuvA [Candidatus Cryosericum sp.]|nr:Holliday junction branch migration protein RuvA [Candidatus Cryosericum sp.]HPS69408.1 Holliday junction branch migration protein RuvA [Candidatus Cryosericum sp.]
MIALIRGNVFRKTDSALVVVAGDVGYEVHVVDTSVFEVGEDVELQTYHVVKEDRQELYGFVNELDYQVFVDLVEHVPGVGAKTALNLLRATTAARLVEAVREQNAALLTSAPGIGKKNAERILIELRPIVNRKYAELVASEAPLLEPSILADVEMALRSLGYSQREISGAVRQLGDPADRGAEELVRDALQLLSEK